MTEETRGLLAEPDEVAATEQPSSAYRKETRSTTSTITGNPTVLVIIATVPETIMSFLVEQIRFLTAHGFEVHTITSPGIEQMPGNDALNSVRHEVAMTRAISPIADLIALFKLWRLLRDLRPTIVQTRTPKAGLLGMIAARIARVPVRVYTVDGLPILTQKFFGRIILAATDWIACALATEVLCVSRSVRRFMIANKLCAKEKTRVLGDGSLSGVNVEKFNPGADREIKAAQTKDRYAIPEEALVIGYIGRLVPDKGVAELASAWKIVRDEFPKAHLFICGYFEPAHPVPPDLAQQLQNDPRVHITGAWLSDMPPIYSALDVCVLPTYREGLSTVAIESGAMQVPIVATRVAGCVDAIRNGVTGLLVEPRDSEALAMALRRLLSDASLRENFGVAARDFVSRHFSSTRTSALVLAEYQRLVQSLDRRDTAAPASGGKSTTVAGSSARSASIHTAA
jgi:glycosyltransferase involved in cell wall biosynthesis